MSLSFGGRNPIANLGVVGINAAAIPNIIDLRKQRHSPTDNKPQFQVIDEPSKEQTIEVGDVVFVDTRQSHNLVLPHGAASFCGFATFAGLTQDDALRHTVIMGVANTPYAPGRSRGSDRPTFTVAAHGTHTIQNTGEVAISPGEIVYCVPNLHSNLRKALVVGSLNPGINALVPPDARGNFVLGLAVSPAKAHARLDVIVSRSAGNHMSL
jgi:hypothetical protein